MPPSSFELHSHMPIANAKIRCVYLEYDKAKYRQILINLRQSWALRRTPPSVTHTKREYSNEVHMIKSCRFRCDEWGLRAAGEDKEDGGKCMHTCASYGIIR